MTKLWVFEDLGSDNVNSVAITRIILPSGAVAVKHYRPATPAEIAEAAGVGELRAQRDALLAATRLMMREDGGNVLVGAIFDTEFRTHGRLTMELVALKDALQAAIALCDKAKVE
jgi:hypothetical protein